MQNLAKDLAVCALLLGAMVEQTSAQTQALGAANIHTQIRNATPIIKKAACNGTTGAYGCGPGLIWSSSVHACVPCQQPVRRCAPGYFFDPGVQKCLSIKNP
jgi:hypothetical protein